MDVYRHPRSMEPLMPGARGRALAELTCQILSACGGLAAQVHSPVVLQAIAAIVREMNCYYSNLIEGHRTLPRDIERAMRQDFSHDTIQRQNQHLGLAHVQVEELLSKRGPEEHPDIYSQEFIRSVHREFYTRLPDSMHWAHTAGGKAYRIEPGQLRDYMVVVGQHTPPDSAALPEFLHRFQEFYGNPEIVETQRLIAIAAAHHRLAWIHPFGDGNGRVIRLHSQALLLRHGIAGHSLWTLSRGLARQRQRYFALLAAADLGRRNDLDGRGNLSDAALGEFCVFFLETMLDQVRFMSGLLELPTLRARIERHFQFQDLHLRRYREELMKTTRVLVDEGEIVRTRVQEITGKGPTVTAEIIKLGLAEGYFTTPSPKGPLRVAFPPGIRESCFPNLYLESTPENSLI